PIVQSGIRTIVNQRLLRKRCNNCDGEALADCENCAGTGYRGRVPIAQCVRLDGHDPVGDAIIASLENGESLASMRSAASKAGGIDLRQRAAALVEKGITNAQEVYRVLGVGPGS
ncbi:MAG: hypothetical protein WBD20_01700, partial [Pirellulaceae bacterium]